MTIALSIKVDDGLVLAADSASSLITKLPDGQMAVMNVYNNANKIFNLRKGLPIGAITWGAGSIGSASTSTLIKDLRRRLSGKDPAHRDWTINPDTYQLSEIAQRLADYVFNEKYLPAFADWPEKPVLGFIVGGYSADAGTADEYQIDINNGVLKGPRLLRQPHESGVTWSGEPEAITRLVLGHAVSLPQVLQKNLGIAADQVAVAMAVIQQHSQVPLVMPAMPIQDAIDIAHFLVDLTVKFSRFTPGAPTVGGPIEIAAITRHEGFKWVARKHYYNTTLNPEGDA